MQKCHSTVISPNLGRKSVSDFSFFPSTQIRTKLFRKLWTQYDTFSRFWTQYDTFSRFWTQYDTFSRFWTQYDTFSRLWTQYDTFSRLWTQYVTFFSSTQIQTNLFRKFYIQMKRFLFIKCNWGKIRATFMNSIFYRLMIFSKTYLKVLSQFFHNRTLYQEFINT
jgi:hypothetical protein